MLASKPVQKEHTMPVRGSYGFSVPVYRVTIYQNEDGVGYYAKCPVDELGCAFTCGDTIRETQENMYESFALLIVDDYPDITNFSFEFVMADKANLPQDRKNRTRSNSWEQGH